jgi:MOSC domain-containing protein YiiM
LLTGAGQHIALVRQYITGTMPIVGKSIPEAWQCVMGRMAMHPAFETKVMTTGSVHAIYIGPKRGQPLVAVAEIRAIAGRGLDGDRYCLGRGSLSRWPGPGRHVTLIEQEVLDAVRREFGIDLGGGLSRRNIVTVGVDLSNQRGQMFRVGTALFKAGIPCAPCGYLERKTQAGVMAALKGRGGLRAEVLQEGIIRMGDLVEFL